MNDDSTGAARPLDDYWVGDFTLRQDELPPTPVRAGRGRCRSSGWRHPTSPCAAVASARCWPPSTAR